MKILISLISGTMVRRGSMVFKRFDKIYKPKLKIRMKCKGCDKTFTAENRNRRYCDSCSQMKYQKK